jgi:hypothetical protein
MQFSRAQFPVPASLIAIALLSAFAISSCEQKPVQPLGNPVPLAHTKSVKCTEKVTVDPSNQSDGVDHKAVYVCGGETLKWDNPQKAVFRVHFVNDCPFESCADITDSTPQPIKTQPTDLTLYKYIITVNGQDHDPHVVGGGY